VPGMGFEPMTFGSPWMGSGRRNPYESDAPPG